MKRRALVIPLLVFQALWLNVVVPGHTRGSIPLPGARVELACAPTGPAGGAATCCPTGSGDPSPGAPGPSGGGCAVCFFAARLSLPPTIDLTLAPAGLLTTLPPPAPSRPAWVQPDARLPFGRAPPVV